jgi:hypothetical protein
MKRIFTILISFGTLLSVQQTFGLGDSSYTEAEELTPQEAATLAYLWENEKHLRDIFLLGTECSDNPEVASAAIVEQGHMDLLKGLLNHYGLEVPVPGEEVGSFTNAYEIFVWTGYGYACLMPDRSIFGFAVLYEEVAIWNLLQAIDETEKERLRDAYDSLLAEACARIRLLATPDGWEPEILDQDLFDQIMADTFPTPSSEGFTINAGLNDAWYYPETDGQGFFISVFADLGSVFLAWFTYDTELPGENAGANLGDPGQRWLIAHGQYEGPQATLTVESVSGGLFDISPPEPVPEAIGTVVLQFEDCSTGSVTYDLPAISRSGVIPIQRVAIDNVPACEAYGQQQDGAQ